MLKKNVQLPKDIRDQKTLTQFKRKLFEYFLDGDVGHTFVAYKFNY